MIEWTVEITRTKFSFTDERWHWSIYENGHVPMSDDAYFCGYAITKNRAMKKAERAIEAIVRGRDREAESVSYHYTPVSDARKT